MTRCWQLDAAGWLAGAVRLESPNYDARAADEKVSLIVIHAISLPPGEFGGAAVLDFFRNQLNPADHPYFADIASQRVSAHFFIRRDGQVVQFVPCLARAWHAGTSCWRSRERCNDFSLGIELEGDELSRFTDTQYQSLSSLLEVLRANFPVEEIVGHADIAAGRKSDPGPYFDWQCIPAARATP